MSSVHERHTLCYMLLYIFTSSAAICVKILLDGLIFLACGFSTYRDVKIMSPSSSFKKGILIIITQLRLWLRLYLHHPLLELVFVVLLLAWLIIYIYILYI